MKHKCGGFYTLLSCQDNAYYLEYLFMFKLIVPASLNMALLKATDNLQKSTNCCIFINKFEQIEYPLLIFISFSLNR